jgi:transposase
MAAAHVSLPDLDALDHDGLKALVLVKHAELHASREQLLDRTSEIEHLKLVIEKLRRMMFGAKSEKVSHRLEQLELQLEELESAKSANQVIQTVAASDKTKDTARGRRARRPLPEHLPREIITHPPVEDCCPECGGWLSKLGEDAAEMLEYIAHSFKVLRHVRTKMSCVACDKIVQAPAPSRPIDHGLAGPGLLAHVLVSKYADHCPLNRQSEIYAREGVEIDRSTLAGWVGAASELLAPLVGAVRKHVMSASKLHADDTPVPVLAPGTGKTKTGRLWTYVRDDRPSGDSTPPAV